METAPQPVFRFAPSPNGHLHLGHAYSAIVNQRMAQEVGGRLLLRIEDIDTTRCTPQLEAQMLEDLAWLGLEWEEPPRRQSDHFDSYAEALEVLREEGLVYPAVLSRSAIRERVAAEPDWPRDPDGQPHYPGDERDLAPDEQMRLAREVPRHAWRLDMRKAVGFVGGVLTWEETGAGPDGESGDAWVDPAAWGDVILARSDTPASYHLCVVLDDALQGVTDVVRGRDLFHATSVHRLLQGLLGLPAPRYHHHDLVLADDGRKLSKSAKDTSLRSLREAGATPGDIARMVGL